MRFVIIYTLNYDEGCQPVDQTVNLVSEAFPQSLYQELAHITKENLAKLKRDWRIHGVPKEGCIEALRLVETSLACDVTAHKLKAQNQVLSSNSNINKVKLIADLRT